MNDPDKSLGEIVKRFKDRMFYMEVDDSLDECRDAIATLAFALIETRRELDGLRELLKRNSDE